MGLKTKKNDPVVEKFLAGITDTQKRTDCWAVLELMKELTGEPAVMWGKAIVGFGSFHYRGKTSEGDWFHVGFSPRKQNLVLYLHLMVRHLLTCHHIQEMLLFLLHSLLVQMQIY